MSEQHPDSNAKATPNLNPSPEEKPYVEPLVGTDRLGRPLTLEERRRFEAVLRAHDFAGQRVAALQYAYNKTHNLARARDLVGRASLRLVRSGWDPDKVPLVNCLVQLVWSEWTHELEETAKRTEAEEMFLLKMDLPRGKTGPSDLDLASRRQAELDERAAAQAQLEQLRALFEQAGDAVNLAWLAFTSEGVTDLAEMASRSDYPVSAFYDATDRRKRLVKRLVAEDAAKKKEKT